MFSMVVVWKVQGPVILERDPCVCKNWALGELHVRAGGCSLCLTHARGWLRCLDRIIPLDCGAIWRVGDKDFSRYSFSDNNSLISRNTVIYNNTNSYVVTLTIRLKQVDARCVLHCKSSFGERIRIQR